MLYILTLSLSHHIAFNSYFTHYPDAQDLLGGSGIAIPFTPFENAVITPLGFALSGGVGSLSVGDVLHVTLPMMFTPNYRAETTCSFIDSVVGILDVTTFTIGRDIWATFAQNYVLNPNASILFYCNNILTPLRPASNLTLSIEILSSTLAVKYTVPSLPIPSVTFPPSNRRLGRFNRLVDPSINIVNTVTDVVVTMDNLFKSLGQGDQLGFTLARHTQGSPNRPVRCAVTQAGIPILFGTTSVQTIGGNMLDIRYTINTRVGISLPSSSLPTLTMLSCSNIRTPLQPQGSHLTPIYTYGSNGSIIETGFASVPEIRERPAFNYTLRGLVYRASATSDPEISFQVDNFLWPFLSNDYMELVLPEGVSTTPRTNCSVRYLGLDVGPTVTMASDSSVLIRFAVTSVPNPTSLGTLIQNIDLDTIGALDIRCTAMNVNANASTITPSQALESTMTAFTTLNSTAANASQLAVARFRQLVSAGFTPSAIQNFVEGWQDDSMNTAYTPPMLGRAMGLVVLDPSVLGGPGTDTQNVGTNTTTPGAGTGTSGSGAIIPPGTNNGTASPNTSLPLTGQVNSQLIPTLSHTVALADSIGNLTLQIPRLMSDLLPGQVIRFPVPANMILPPMAVCSTNKLPAVATTEPGFISVAAPIIIFASTLTPVTVTCNNVRTTSTSVPQILPPARIQTPPPGEIIFQSFGNTTFTSIRAPEIIIATVVHDADTTFARGDMLVEMVSLPAGTNRLTVNIPKYLLEYSTTNFTCGLAVKGVPQPSVVPSVDAVNNTLTIVGFTVLEEMSDAVLKCANVYRSRYVHPVIGGLSLTGWNEANKAAIAPNMTLNELTKPTVLSRGDLRMTLDRNLTGAFSTINATVQEPLPAPLLKNDRVGMRVPSGWTLPTQAPTCVMFDSNWNTIQSSAIGIYGDPSMVTVRLLEDVASSAYPITLTCALYRNPMEKTDALANSTQVQMRVTNATGAMSMLIDRGSIQAVRDLAFVNNVTAIVPLVTNQSTAFQFDLIDSYAPGSVLQVALPSNTIRSNPNNATSCFFDGVLMSNSSIVSGTLLKVTLPQLVPGRQPSPRQLICDGVYIPPRASPPPTPPQNVTMTLLSREGPEPRTTAAVTDTGSTGTNTAFGAKIFQIYTPSLVTDSVTSFAAAFNPMPINLPAINSSFPAIIRMSMPRGWNFTGPCTVSQGDFNEMLAGVTMEQKSSNGNSSLGSSDAVLRIVNGTLLSGDMNTYIMCETVRTSPASSSEQLVSMTVGYEQGNARAAVGKASMNIGSLLASPFDTALSFNPPLAGAASRMIITVKGVNFTSGDTLVVKLPNAFTNATNATQCVLEDTAGAMNLTSTFARDTQAATRTVIKAVISESRFVESGTVTCDNIRNAPFAAPASSNLVAGVVQQGFETFRAGTEEGMVGQLSPSALGTRMSTMLAATRGTQQAASFIMSPLTNPVPGNGTVSLATPANLILDTSSCMAKVNGQSTPITAMMTNATNLLVRFTKGINQPDATLWVECLTPKNLGPGNGIPQVTGLKAFTAMPGNSPRIDEMMQPLLGQSKIPENVPSIPVVQLLFEVPTQRVLSSTELKKLLLSLSGGLGQGNVASLFSQRIEYWGSNPMSPSNVDAGSAAAGAGAGGNSAQQYKAQTIKTLTAGAPQAAEVAEFDADVSASSLYAYNDGNDDVLRYIQTFESTEMTPKAVGVKNVLTITVEASDPQNTLPLLLNASNARATPFLVDNVVSSAGMAPTVVAMPMIRGIPYSCTDKQKTLNETDVDCGGSDCAQCNNGYACLVDYDCVSNICSNGRCKDAYESDPNTSAGAVHGPVVMSVTAAVTAVLSAIALLVSHKAFT